MTNLFQELKTYLERDRAQIEPEIAEHGDPIRLLQMSSAHLWIFSDGYRLTISSV